MACNLVRNTKNKHDLWTNQWKQKSNRNARKGVIGGIRRRSHPGCKQPCLSTTNVTKGLKANRWKRLFTNLAMAAPLAESLEMEQLFLVWKSSGTELARFAQSLSQLDMCFSFRCMHGLLFNSFVCFFILPVCLSGSKFSLSEFQICDLVFRNWSGIQILDGCLA